MTMLSKPSLEINSQLQNKKEHKLSRLTDVFKRYMSNEYNSMTV